MTVLDAAGSTVAELSAALRSGALTASALARQAVRRAALAGDRYGAIAALAERRAEAEAAVAEDCLAAGDTGPLVGIPYGVKDVIAARGAPTSWGVVNLRDRVIDADAIVVDRLSRAGAVLVAKLVTSSLAGAGGITRAGMSVHGQPRNPWAPERFPGGSSHGSAITVALGVVPFALGTETRGSVIQPAAFCGVTGFRPTWGRVPRTGTMTSSVDLDKIGILARSADDCAVVFDVVDGPDGMVADCTAAPNGPVFAPSRLRLGVSPREWDNAAPGIAAGARRGLGEMAELVAGVGFAQISNAPAYGMALQLIVSVDAANSLRPLLDDPRTKVVEPDQLDRLRAALNVPVAMYEAAREMRKRAATEFAHVFHEVDVLVGLAAANPPQPLRLLGRPPAAPTVSDQVLAAANLAGLPGVAVPCGIDDTTGLPVSLHLVGPPGSDHTLLALASAYQRATDHHRLMPAAANDAIRWSEVQMVRHQDEADGAHRGVAEGPRR